MTVTEQAENGMQHSSGMGASFWEEMSPVNSSVASSSKVTPLTEGSNVVEGPLENTDPRFTRSARTMPAIREESSGSSQRTPVLASSSPPPEASQSSHQFSSLLRSRGASPSESLASLVADDGSILEESLPEMVRLYRAKLSSIDDDDLSESLLEEFDRILVLKNKRLWKVTQHLTQKMKETAEFYRAIVDNKDYQLQLYRNRIKALVQQLLDVLATSDNQEQIPPELMNPFLLNILTELSAGDATPPKTEAHVAINDGNHGNANVSRELSHRSALAPPVQRSLRIPTCLLPEKLLCRPNCKKRDKS